MLYRYEDGSGWVSLSPRREGAILTTLREIEYFRSRFALPADRRVYLQRRHVQEYYPKESISFRDLGLPSLTEKQTAKGRIRAALMKAFPLLKHAEISCMVRRVMKAARFVRLDSEHGETHLAFSPDGVGAWDLKRRRSLTFAKFLRRKCGKVFTGAWSLSDAMIDKASAAFRTIPVVGSKLNIVSGHDAYLVYADENGISSCMAYGGCGGPEMVQHHFEANPEKLKLVIARDESNKNRLAIRAKLWINDSGNAWLDRVYWSGNCDLGEMTKSGNSAENLAVWIKAWLSTQGYVMQENCKCTLTHESGENMPYLDKCRYFDRLNDRQILVHDDGEFCAENTDGTYESVEGSGCCCHGCNERYDEDDMRTDDSGHLYCESCYSDRYTYDDIDEHDIASEDAVSAVRIDNGRRRDVTTHTDNCTQCYCGAYVYNDDVVELHDGENAASDDNDLRELHDGRYAIHGRDNIVQTHDEEWALLDDCYCCHDGEYALCDDVVMMHDQQFALADDCERLTDGRYALECEVVETVDEKMCLGSECVELSDDSGFAHRDDVVMVTDDYGNELTILAATVDV